MNCTSVLNSLRKTISPLLTLTPGVGIQQTRVMIIILFANIHFDSDT